VREFKSVVGRESPLVEHVIAGAIENDYPLEKGLSAWIALSFEFSEAKAKKRNAFRDGKIILKNAVMS